jgi:hypothetical protein
VAFGFVSPETCVAAAQFASVIGKVEYLTSYCAAVPVVPSFPGAVHVSATLDMVASIAARSVTAAGGVPSDGGLTELSVLEQAATITKIAASHSKTSRAQRRLSTMFPSSVTNVPEAGLDVSIPRCRLAADTLEI